LTPAGKQKLRAWIAAALWLGLIAGESTSLGSAENTGRILFPLLHFLMGLDLSRFEVVHFYIRKSGHFFGYFMLSWLLFRAWKASLSFPGMRWSIQWAGIAFFMTALVASLDEWHQTFIPGRTGLVSDVVLDSSAAFVAQLVIFLWFRFKNSSPRNRLGEASAAD